MAGSNASQSRRRLADRRRYFTVAFSPREILRGRCRRRTSRSAKRIYAAWNKGGPTAASIYYDPEIEWQGAAEVPDADVVRGRKAVLAYLDEWIGLFGSTRGEVQELIRSTRSI